MPPIERIKIGDRVRLVRIPPVLSDVPEETHRVFELCVGGEFTVESLNSYGLTELDVSEKVDKVVGGFLNSIWVELEYLEKISQHEEIQISKSLCSLTIYWSPSTRLRINAPEIQPGLPNVCV